MNIIHLSIKICHTTKMLDHVVATFGQITPYKLSAKYKSEHSIKEKLYVHANGSKVLNVIFLPWGMGVNFAKRTIVPNLSPKGDSVLVYEFHPSILNADVELVSKSFGFASDAVANEVNNLIDKVGYKNINLIGISLGCAVLSMSANKIKLFTAVTMIVPGNDITEIVWSGNRTKQLKKQLLKTDAIFEDVKAKWSNISPENNLDALKGRNLKVILAKKDTFIRYEHGLELVRKAKLYGLDPIVIVKNIDHATAILSTKLVD